MEINEVKIPVPWGHIAGKYYILKKYMLFINIK